MNVNIRIKMSNVTNETLIEEAKSYLNGDLSSTPLEGMIQADLDTNDLESLWFHVAEARDLLRDE